MKKKVRKLTLAKETLRILNTRPLQEVAGGFFTNTCYATCSEGSCFNTCDTCRLCPTDVSACVTDCGC